MVLADDRFKVIEEDVILVGLADLNAARDIRRSNENSDQPPLPEDDQVEDNQS